MSPLSGHSEDKGSTLDGLLTVDRRGAGKGCVTPSPARVLVLFREKLFLRDRLGRQGSPLPGDQVVRLSVEIQTGEAILQVLQGLFQPRQRLCRTFKSSGRTCSSFPGSIDLIPARDVFQDQILVPPAFPRSEPALPVQIIHHFAQFHFGPLYPKIRYRPPKRAKHIR